MATRGRKPKPTAVKKLEGNPSGRPLNENEPKPSGFAECPDWLEPDAKEEWNRLGGELKKLGLLTSADMAAFAGYCQAYARWKEAEQYLTTHGSVMTTASGYKQQVPQVSIAQTNLKLVLKFCEQFGLTPSARSRIISNTAGDDSEDPMEQLLGGE